MAWQPLTAVSNFWTELYNTATENVTSKCSKSNIPLIGLCLWECSYEINCHVDCSTFSLLHHHDPQLLYICPKQWPALLCIRYAPSVLCLPSHSVKFHASLCCPYVKNNTTHTQLPHYCSVATLSKHSHLSQYILNVVSLTSIFNWLQDC